MKSIQIVATGSYLPKVKIDNSKIAEQFNVNDEFIYKRTGIETRYYAEHETIEQLAIEAVKNLIQKNAQVNINEVNMIIVSTTSTNLLMPGISYKIQEEFNIKDCMCLDILAGCAGFINALDIARNYIILGKVNKVILIGVDILSKNLDKSDISTSIVLSDGAGSILIEKMEDVKQYESIIKSYGQKGNLLEMKTDQNIKMNGKEIYKYAVTETVKNIQEIIKRSELKIDQIKYIIPHQSNLKIMNSIANRLNINNEKIYMNIKNVGNTFCASIPIVIDEMFQNDLLEKGDKIILLGYGGGLNTGSVLMEV